MCEVAPICYVEQSESKNECENERIKCEQKPKTKISWRKLNKNEQIKSNINELPLSSQSKRNQVDEMSVQEEAEGDDVDEQSYDSEIGIIDGIRPPPNKADIVEQLWRPRNCKVRNNHTAEQRTNQGDSALAMEKNMF